MNLYKEKFHGDNFIFDDFAGNFEALKKAKCLITDNSGISIEYMLIFKRPVFIMVSLIKYITKNLICTKI